MGVDSGADEGSVQSHPTKAVGRAGKAVGRSPNRETDCRIRGTESPGAGRGQCDWTDLEEVGALSRSIEQDARQARAVMLCYVRPGACRGRQLHRSRAVVAVFSSAVVIVIIATHRFFHHCRRP